MPPPPHRESSTSTSLIRNTLPICISTHNNFNSRKPEITIMGIGSSSPTPPPSTNIPINKKNYSKSTPSTSSQVLLSVKEKTISLPPQKTSFTSTTTTTFKPQNAKFKEIPMKPLSELKNMLSYYDDFGSLYFNSNLIKDYAKEITILLTYSIHNEYISNIKDNLDKALIKFLSMDGHAKNNNDIEEFLDDFKSLHLQCFKIQKATEEKQSANYLHLFTQTVAKNHDMSISDLIGCVKKFADELPKYTELHARSKKKRKIDVVSDEKTECITRMNESLTRAEKYMKKSKTEITDYASHLLDVAPSPTVQFHTHSTEECDKFLFPFRGDVLELDKYQYPTLFEWSQETKLHMQQDLSGKISSFGVPSIEKGMEFCVRFTCEQLSPKVTGKPLPVHLQKLLNYFDEIDSLSNTITDNETSKNTRHIADVSDLILHDPVENKMKLMHPYYQYYYYHYYLSLYNSFENEKPESEENPFLSMAPPKTKPLNRPLFGKRVRNMRNAHPDETPTLESFPSFEFGFPYNLSRNNLQTDQGHTH
ncbi:predicted protein [Naegleria gruberi]|uniref:Predicted protein n=1 Tax=Naegleria gruberi TaxID=5762 RepID=D2VG02_NAEGR|nr:uncharacterized protein NAEGRDRAFT_49227 [Naegleria gruberi]EFC44173.1 predicted protein [Naegleria gruberi]|eukprot:XP_002676917.1 predicted protein [Naegleria gruberi strain NEG-M]